MDRDKSPTPGELTILIAGAVMLVASFLNFAFSTNAWGTGLFPLATLLPLYGTVMALQIGLAEFVNVKFPSRVAGFTWEQIHLVLGALAALMAIGWFITDTGSKQIGLYLEAVGGVALLFGAVRMQRERNTGAFG